MSYEKAISIGLESGEYGGRNRSRAPTFSIASRTPLILWAGRLMANSRWQRSKANDASRSHEAF